MTFFEFQNVVCAAAFTQWLASGPSDLGRGGQGRGDTFRTRLGPVMYENGRDFIWDSR